MKTKRGVLTRKTKKERTAKKVAIKTGVDFEARHMDGRVWFDIDQLIELFEGFPQPEIQTISKFSVYTLRQVKEKAVNGLGGKP